MVLKFKPAGSFKVKAGCPLHSRALLETIASPLGIFGVSCRPHPYAFLPSHAPNLSLCHMAPLTKASDGMRGIEKAASTQGMISD